MLSSAARIDELLSSRSYGTAAGDGGSELVTSQMTDARRTLILDLSSKVTEQQTEIVRLRERLRATHAHDRTADFSQTSSAVDSEVPGCSWESSAGHDPGTDCVGGRRTDEGCGRLRSEGGEVRATAASGGAVKIDSTLLLSRLSPAASLDRTCSAERRRTVTGRYQAHWASSCFDVQDEIIGDDEEAVVMTKTTSAAQT